MNNKKPFVLFMLYFYANLKAFSGYTTKKYTFKLSDPNNPLIPAIYFCPQKATERDEWYLFVLFNSIF